MSTQTLRRTICPEVRIDDEKKGIATYIASDETLDCYREIIRADGWRFDFFKKNAPFVDSHNYYTLDNLLGKVVDFKVAGRKLEETVQWALDIPEHRLAKLGWELTKGGFLKAVSVGFRPEKMVSRWDNDQSSFQTQCLELGVKPDAVRCIYTQQQQLELSACIIGANPNALAKAYKAQALKDDDLKFLLNSLAESTKGDEAPTPRESGLQTGISRTDKDFPKSKAASKPDRAHSTQRALVEWAEARTAESFLEEFEKALAGLA